MVDIMFGEGISKTGELLTIAVNEDIVKKAGAWFSYNDEKIGQGTEKAKIFLKEHSEIFNEIDRKVREKYGLIKKSESDIKEEKSKPKEKNSKKVELQDIELEVE